MTAEALMRSRYAAFSVGDLDYLVATLHPSKRRPDERAQLADGANRLRWVGLTIQDTRGGTALDTTGEVAFEAAYLAGKVRGVLRERSRFVREADGWYYLDGDV